MARSKSDGGMQLFIPGARPRTQFQPQGMWLATTAIFFQLHHLHYPRGIPSFPIQNVSTPLSVMAFALLLPPEVWGITLDCLRDHQSQEELIYLRTTVRQVCRQFKTMIEEIFRQEHLPKVWIRVNYRKSANGIPVNRPQMCCLGLILGQLPGHSSKMI